MFSDINVGWPGKIYDASAFALLELYERSDRDALLPRVTETFEGIDVLLVILGDLAYSWVRQEQLVFNHHLSQACMTERPMFPKGMQCLQYPGHSNHKSMLCSIQLLWSSQWTIPWWRHWWEKKMKTTTMKWIWDGPQQDNGRASEIRDALCRYVSRISRFLSLDFWLCVVVNILLYVISMCDGLYSLLTLFLYNNKLEQSYF